jgi:NADH-quinone oxidoreductase subunit J
MIINALLVIGILVFTLIAIFSKRLLISAVSLGLTSVMLAIIFYAMGAPFAGGFELSIGAGLVSILFIMAISLTERGKHES